MIALRRFWDRHYLTITLWLLFVGHLAMLALKGPGTMLLSLAATVFISIASWLLA